MIVCVSERLKNRKRLDLKRNVNDNKSVLIQYSLNNLDNIFINLTSKNMVAYGRFYVKPSTCVMGKMEFLSRT